MDENSRSIEQLCAALKDSYSGTRRLAALELKKSVILALSAHLSLH